MDCDAKAKLFEATNQATLDGGAVALIEVVPAEVSVWAGVFEKMPGYFDNAVADSNCRFLLTTPGDHTVVLCTEVSGLGVSRGVSGLD